LNSIRRVSFPFSLIHTYSLRAHQVIFPLRTVQRLTLDVSNVLYSFFINIDKILYSHLANNRQEWSQLLLEHRFLELRKLNAVFDFLLEKFPTATILDSIFDHATDRRWTKIIAEVTRQDALAAAKAKRLAVEATKLYEKNGGKAAGCPPPRELPLSSSSLSLCLHDNR